MVTYLYTPRTHTRSSGQPFMLWRSGSSQWFGALLKGTLVVVLRVERVLYNHSRQLQFQPVRDSNSQPLNYESDSLTIRPRLPQDFRIHLVSCSQAFRLTAEGLECMVAFIGKGMSNNQSQFILFSVTIWERGNVTTITVCQTLGHILKILCCAL